MLYGCDISYANARTPDLAGMAFVFVRATYGAAQDALWATHSRDVRAAHKYLGAYAFGVGGAQEPVTRQAAAFLSIASGADFLALDVEQNGSGGAPSMTLAEADAFCRYVQNHGRRIILYHSRSGFPSVKAVHFNYRWVAQWTPTPPKGLTWTFWQMAGTKLDRDAFNGDAAALRALAVASHVK